jgi:HEAT repeat protein
MPSFITARLLIAVIAVGSVLAYGLLVATVASRFLRGFTGGRRARAEVRVRPMVLAAASGEEVPPELLTARGATGRAAERLIFAYLAQLRGEAAGLLAEVVRRRGTVDRILRYTHSPASHRRASAAEQLGLIASPQAQYRLMELVTGDHSLEVRIVATRALGKTGSALAAQTLLRSLSRADPVPEGIVSAALLELGPEAVPALREALGGPPAGGRRQRAMAANVLGLLDDMPAWKGMVSNITSRDLEVRISAVRALGRIGLPQPAEAIAACLRPEEDSDLRAIAASALGLIGDPRAASALAACLGDPQYWVAHNAAGALAELGSAGVAVLAKAASGTGSGAAHAREALARRALSRGEPLAPAARQAPDNGPASAVGSTRPGAAQSAKANAGDSAQEGAAGTAPPRAGGSARADVTGSTRVGAS